MFGNDRKVWNLMLDMAQQRYYFQKATLLYKRNKHSSS
ncbi:hypothetical protein LRS72_00230 [Limosilactobacillus fermentum]|nr:hypothetical protein [Limosilactobacillus fermentum]